MRLFVFHLPILVLAASCAHASTFTYNQVVTIQPGQIFYNGSYEEYDQSLPTGPSFTVQAGDTITGTISFADGPVTIMNAANKFDNYAYISFGPTNLSVSDAASSADSWVGLTVAPGTTGPLTSGSVTGCCVDAGDLGTAAAHNYSFTGLTYSITFSSVSLNGSQVSAAYTPGYFYMGGDTLTFQASGAPEPGSLALLCIGGAFLAFCSVFRRRMSIRCRAAQHGVEVVA